MIYSILLSALVVFHSHASTFLDDPLLSEVILNKIKVEEPTINFGEKLHVLSEVVDERKPYDSTYVCLTTDSMDKPLYLVNYDVTNDHIALVSENAGSAISNKVIQHIDHYMDKDFVMKKESGYVITKIKIHRSLTDFPDHNFDLVYKKSVFKDFLCRNLRVKPIVNTSGNIERFAIYEQVGSELKEVTKMYFVTNYFLGKAIGIKRIEISHL